MIDMRSNGIMGWHILQSCMARLRIDACNHCTYRRQVPLVELGTLSGYVYLYSKLLGNKAQVQNIAGREVKI